MFEKKYKQAMDNIVPDESILNSVINGSKRKPTFKSSLKIIIAACLSAIILCTSIFVTLNLSKIDAPDNLNIDNISTLISSNDSDSDNSSFSDDSTESDVSSIIDDASSENSSEDITVDSTDDTTNVENESTEEPSSEDISDDVAVPDEPSNDSSSDDSSSNHIDADEKIPDSFNELGFKYAESYEEIHTLMTDKPQSPDGSDASEDSAEDDQDDPIDFNTILSDQKNIYILQADSNTVSIISGNDGNPESLSSVTIDSNMTPKTILIADDILVVICGNSFNTSCILYDIYDASNPKMIGSFSQSGDLLNCVIYDGKIYTITKNNTEGEVNLPLINGESIDYKNIIISEEHSKSLLIFTAYNLTKNELIDSSAFLGDNCSFYLNDKNIYIAKTIESSLEPAPNLESATPIHSTLILKLSLTNGNFKVVAAGKIDGKLESADAMNETENSFSVISKIHYSYKNNMDITKNKHFYQVYCLNNELQITGISENFATNTYPLSIGHFGNTAYLTTYEKGYVIHAVNISNPYSPTFISEFELEQRFSQLAEFGYKHILGMNIHRDRQTGITAGFELRLYDGNSQSYNEGGFYYSTAWEADNYLNKNISYSEENLILDSKNGLIGIAFYSRKTNKDDDSKTTTFTYEFCRFDGSAITEIGRTSFSFDGVCYTIDSVRIEEYFYFISGNQIVSISVADLEG